MPLEYTNLPINWLSVKLEDLLICMKNGANVKQYDEEIGFPISRIETIWNEKIDLTRVKYIKENSKEFVEKYELKDNDILFSHINSDLHLGKTALFHKTKSKTLIHGINLLLLRPSSEISASWLNYQLKYHRYKGSFVSAGQKAVNQTSINQSKLKAFNLVLAPKSEQERIVSKIEELFSSLDKGVESLKTAQQQLKTYRQAVLKYAFEGKLTNDNSEWEYTTLGKTISISSGQGLTKNNRQDEGQYWVYGGNGITGKHSKYMFENEKLIIGRVGVHCGNVHITKSKSWITDNAFVVSFNEDEIDMKFLYFLILELNLNKYSSSTAQPVISQGKLYPIKVLLPQTKEIQQIIVKEIESRLSVCDKIEESINKSLAQAESLRQSILKKAFEGKLVPQDPNDEPASVLLERIKAEKEQYSSVKQAMVKEHTRQIRPAVKAAIKSKK